MSRLSSPQFSASRPAPWNPAAEGKFAVPRRAAIVLTALAVATTLVGCASRSPSDEGSQAVRDSAQDAPVQFSPARGLYDAPFDLTLAAGPGQIIHYTRDGTAPDRDNGHRYDGPIAITTTTSIRAAAFQSDGEPSPVVTHSYLFPSDVARQPAQPPGFPSHWAGEEADYAMDDRAGRPEEIAAALRALPSISLVLDPADIFGATAGIYAHPTAEGGEWERPASMELIHAEGGAGFQENAGLRIQGGWGRRPDKSPKHSFRVLFKKKYGPGELEHPLFPDGPVESFDTLVLRANFNDSWTVNVDGQRERALYARDAWHHDAFRHMGWPAPRGFFAHLYVNSLYWGIYHPVERPDGNFAAAYLGGRKEDYDVLNSGEVVEGDDRAWLPLMELAKGDTSTAAALATLAEQVDLDNLVDYMLLELFIANQDWPKKNWYATRRRDPPGRWQFYTWDGERGLEFADREVEDPFRWQTPGFLFGRLLENAAFRDRVSERLAMHLAPGGALHVDDSQPEWDPAHPERNAPAARLATLLDPLEPAMVAEAARWGDVRRPERPFGPAEWRAERARLLTEVLPQRNRHFLARLAGWGVHPAAAAEPPPR